MANSPIPEMHASEDMQTPCTRHIFIVQVHAGTDIAGQIGVRT